MIRRQHPLLLTVFVALLVVTKISHAGSFLKSTVYPVTPDMSQMQAVEKALLMLQTEAIQETGVLVQQVLKIEKTEFLELSQENIQQLASAVTLTRIISQSFDGKELFLTAEIQVDDSHIFNSLTHLKSLTLAEDEVTRLKSELATQQAGREQAENALFRQQQQTERQRDQIRSLKARIALLERLNHQQLTEANRLKTAETKSTKLKQDIGQRLDKQRKRFVADVSFYQNAWAHGMTVKDARQYHRFVHKPFYSELDKMTFSFIDASYKERFSEEKHDTYVIQQAYLKDKMTYLLAVTHKGHGRIKNIYVATEVQRNENNQVKVTSIPLMQANMGKLKSESIGRSQRF